MEFPISLNVFNVDSSLALSLGCKPIDGSSSIYKTPINCDPIWVAKRILCDSPPDNVIAERFNDK